MGKARFRPDQQYTVYVFLISIIIRFSFSKKLLSFSISFAKISLYYTGRNVVQGEDYRCRRAGSMLLRDVSHASLVARRYTPVSLAYSLPSAVYSSHSDKPENETANVFRHAMRQLRKNPSHAEQTFRHAMEFTVVFGFGLASALARLRHAHASWRAVNVSRKWDWDL